MKKHNTLKIVLVTMLICMILTWIFDAAYFSSEFVNQGKVQMGLFDLFNYPLTSLSYFGYIALYIIVVGGFYGILNKIPAYHNMVDGCAKKLSKHSLISISVIMILLAVITSICGLQLGLILFFPLIVSLVLAMGFDKIVAALVTVGSTMVGVIGTTYAYSNTSMLMNILDESITDNIAIKFAVLIAALFLLVLNTILYIKKGNKSKKVEKTVKEVEVEEKVEEVKVEVKGTTTKSKTTTKSSNKSNTKSSSKNSSKSNSKKTTGKKSTSKSKNNNKAAVLDEEVIVVKNNKKVITWPVVVAFVILLVIMILAFIPWNDVFGISAMEDATNAINSFKIFKFELFAKLLGNYNTFGSWMITDMFLPMAFITLILSIIYRVKFDDVVDGFVSGAKKAVLPAVLSLLIYTVLVINTYHPYQLTIYKMILGKSSSLNVVTSSVTGLLSSILNVDPAYTFQSVIPYLTSLVTEGEVHPIIWVIFQSMYGFAMLFAPTSVVLMGVLSYLEVSYKDWLKAIWKLLLELFVVLLIIFTILILM